jgi:hypothetical protein
VLEKRCHDGEDRILGPGAGRLRDTDPQHHRRAWARDRSRATRGEAERQRTTRDGGAREAGGSKAPG